MTQLRLRFPNQEIPRVAERYSGTPEEMRREEEIEEEIAPRVRQAGYFTKQDFLVLTRWKSPRAQPRCEANAESFVEEATQTALAARDERLRIGVLQLLNGVSWPTASVLLHFGSQDPYPIVDFRALWSLGVETRPTYTFSFWWDYVQACRSLAVQADVSMRTLDRALWQYSKDHQM